MLETLRRDAHASYATITTLEPLTDVSYIPCVSLLDFWLRSGSLELVVYAHSIDFGKKGFGNLVQLAELQRDVASELNAPVGPLVMIVKSATIYQTELEFDERDDFICAARRQKGHERKRVSELMPDNQKGSALMPNWLLVAAAVRAAFAPRPGPCRAGLFSRAGQPR